MAPVKLVREIDAFRHTLDVDVFHWKGEWRVRVIERCDEKSPMPTSLDFLDGGATEKDTVPLAKQALGRFIEAGWFERLPAEAQARIDARRNALPKKPAPRPAPKKPAAPQANLAKMHTEQAKHARKTLALGEKKNVPEKALSKLLRPCVELLTRKPKKTDRTRIGGLPNLAGAWPKAKKGSKAPMVFVAQLDLAEITEFDTKRLLPKKGLLAFFVGDFDDGIVTHSEKPGAPATWPAKATFADFVRVNPYPACGVTLRGAVSIPFSNPDYANEENEDAGWYGLASSYRQNKEAPHQLLGYELGDTGDAIEDDDVILLRLGSDDLANMEWGDVGNLYVVIDSKALAARQWNRVRVISTE